VSKFFLQSVSSFQHYVTLREHFLFEPPVVLEGLLARFTNLHSLTLVASTKSETPKALPQVDFGRLARNLSSTIHTIKIEGELLPAFLTNVEEIILGDSDSLLPKELPRMQHVQIFSMASKWQRFRSP
jgi:hypothetical protein